MASVEELYQRFLEWPNEQKMNRALIVKKYKGLAINNDVLICELNCKMYEMNNGHAHILFCYEDNASVNNEEGACNKYINEVDIYFDEYDRIADIGVISSNCVVSTSGHEMKYKRCRAVSKQYCQLDAMLRNAVYPLNEQIRIDCKNWRYLADWPWWVDYTYTLLNRKYRGKIVDIDAAKCKLLNLTIQNGILNGQFDKLDMDYNEHCISVNLQVFDNRIIRKIIPEKASVLVSESERWSTRRSHTMSWYEISCLDTMLSQIVLSDENPCVDIDDRNRAKERLLAELGPMKNRF